MRRSLWSPLLRHLLNGPEMRVTPSEIRTTALDGNQIGSSGLARAHTKVVFGDPSKVGFYTILLFVSAHTTIRAHSH
ncbi:MAG: hypothetical protein ACR2JB_00210 [Bryobacteraceae bacterium]